MKSSCATRWGATADFLFDPVSKKMVLSEQIALAFQKPSKNVALSPRENLKIEATVPRDSAISPVP